MLTVSTFKLITVLQYPETSSTAQIFIPPDRKLFCILNKWQHFPYTSSHPKSKRLTLKVENHSVLYPILEFMKIDNLLFYPFVCHHYYFLCCHWRMPHSLSVHVSHCYLDFHSHWIHCCVQAVKNKRIYIICTSFQQKWNCY